MYKSIIYTLEKHSKIFTENIKRITYNIMKKILLFLITYLLSLETIYSYEFIDIYNSSECSITYNCDSIVLDQNKNNLILSGNVNFQVYNYINIKAEKLYWDVNKQKISASNVTSFQLNGTLITETRNFNITNIEYTIGDSVAYIK